MKSLWSEDIKKKGNATPHFILKRQAKLLASSTNNILKGKVTEKMNAVGSILRGVDRISYEFLIVCDLMDYQFSLLKVTHDILKPFPVKLLCTFRDLDKRSIEVNNTDELEQEIKSILNKKEIIEALNALFLQAGEKLPTQVTT